ncbi:hypothetical protein C0995_013547 [Termitomyces sp. Mi166|nr:hypothetical protein C0995_013547 [Termitomyces sp. Mi166\
MDNASWSTKDETVLLDFLLTHAMAAEDGGNFEMVTFTAAAAAMLEKKHMKGGPKTGKACQNKWNALCWTSRAIQAIKLSKSGWTWTDMHGANISTDMDDAWRAFCKIHKEAKPFQNKG